ncbi:MAG: hypothetical protein NC483_01925 [Ruminococcus sp.]|nr:hypothetical protein [Ruminococcus sp.]
MKRKSFKLVRTNFVGPVFAALGVKKMETPIKTDFGTIVKDTTPRFRTNPKGRSRVLNPARKILKCNKKPTENKGE